MGAFWFPGIMIEDMPLVGSVKISLPSFAEAQFAGGIMYIRFPGFDDGISRGMGFTFVTGTIEIILPMHQPAWAGVILDLKVIGNLWMIPF